VEVKDSRTDSANPGHGRFFPPRKERSSITKEDYENRRESKVRETHVKTTLKVGRGELQFEITVPDLEKEEGNKGWEERNLEKSHGALETLKSEKKIAVAGLRGVGEGWIRGLPGHRWGK